MILSTISFPGLGIKNLNLDSVAFSIGDFSVAWYGLIITLGMILCVSYIIWRARQIGISSDIIIDYAIFVIPIGIIGARLYYVLMKLEDFDSIWDALNIRNGGLAIYGGILAGTLTVYVISRIRKISFAALGDCVVPGLILAQSIGRWGNFMNVEAYGSLTSLPWRMSGITIAKEMYSKGLADSIQYNQILEGSLGVHPTFFYESMWNLLGFVLINIFYKRKKYDGQIILLVFAWYGLGRMIIEGLRTDSLYLFGSSIRVSQLLAFCIFVICVSALVYFIFNKPKKERYIYKLSKKE